MLVGLNASFAHDQNGMTLNDMEAAKRVATRLNEVIIFRSTGPWSKRWLERGYPSKNFHVKGKSSDWGPHAGLVPYNGLYSKVGYDAEKALRGTQANDDGLDSRFAIKRPLLLSLAQIEEQLTRAEGRPARTAIDVRTPIPGSRDFLLTARRSGDGKPVVFRAFAIGQSDQYEIRVYPPVGLANTNSFMILDKDPQGLRAEVFEVMCSNEMGAGQPMTGDYDLFAVCPSWGQYGSRAEADIIKPGIQLQDGTLHKGVAFRAGQGMDNVLDPSLHTQSRAGDFHLRRNAALHSLRDGISAEKFQNYFGVSDRSEHADMGNLTPRILRCINQLNVAMGAVGEQAPMRRVHHNAESHRNRAFGALSAHDMLTVKPGDSYGDGFPLTVFQPSSLYSGNAAADERIQVARYRDVCTLESLTEFEAYAAALKESGFYVPKNWIWARAAA